ncbi:hypothetical protein A2130_00320 [Candidatus Woesebacteria bacterium GWC2_33_12]|uniref:Glycerate dehydrogenase n=1 Tax=Candidatus Woesebacteria bacterium GW2011_GWB1_33_22 TaxID=1618566 RepID=A0A0G0C0R3_9BACT|nr:MAG: Glycerate dehydrogenase [Candidatus Woesebacteria bacterium GW2011_GWC2_33_12]KKP42080.1 MAG: Glycerate dehydrogenase [Candidatus Woesebacteria bacterium GW2011_GWA2_33_20]KKP44770.1 MAG: Glycerate dehydrogenase [Candidatus Woesebacteria bacterium GW2011_GWB1_33_22]KKP46589.1 MAG: Glycerate dehydrogenase [Microgenomates group bacterium GW2011_GWC1_33_28]KKP50502.1 MAG: Glycerate dehydrogenase [Candidatus Woesebacteria bacterium GW2011_GWA1_33_33]OGM07665.1 MAG: hypothetical protein A21
MNTKNISVLCSKDKFTDVQLQRLNGLGRVNFIENIGSKCPGDTEILIVPTASHESKFKNRLSELLSLLPNLKFLVLGSSDYSFVDLGICKEKGITISFVPFYDAKSKAEFAIGLLFTGSRRILINDRMTYRRKYQPEPGFELIGKRLGIIGSGIAVEETVRLAKALGITVYTEERFEDSIRQPLDNLLHDSDLLVLFLPNSEENRNFLSKDKITQLKNEVIIVNLSDRDVVSESAMAKALIDGKVSQYIFEAESIGKTPLKNIESALMLKPFSTDTVETKEKNIEGMVKNTEDIVLNLRFSKVYF